MSTTRLPELPAPNGFRPDSAYTADQLHAYGLAVWRAAIETAAERIPSNWLDSMLTGKGGLGQPPYSCADIEKLLTNLRAAIRSLPDPSVIQQARLGKNE